jgi:ferrous iron transport protein B
MISNPSQRKSVALIGNPNTGKSSLFNALCGSSARVGNYPGVTVEQKVGTLLQSAIPTDVIDLPGTYSLAARSADEAVTIDVLCGARRDTPRPDAIVVIVDATNLERNLYLVSQVLELGLPTLLVLNMWDRAESEKHRIDVSRLSERLGVPVVCTTASRRAGVEKVREAIGRLLDVPSGRSESRFPRNEFPKVFLEESEKLQSHLSSRGVSLPLLEVDRMLIDREGHFERNAAQKFPGILQELSEARQRLEASGVKIPLFETKSRYAWVRRQLDGIVERPPVNTKSVSDRIDRWLTHRWIGLIFFVLLMFLIFQSITALAAWPMDWIESTQGILQNAVEQFIAPGALRSLVVDGILAGIGSVLMFMPQIAILFLFIAILEDCGYMTRAAFVVDKMMSTVGLSGRSFLPLMSSFACAVPGIMATRTIDNSRDRMVTILIAPLMSCSARLPVYVLMVSAFVPSGIKYLGGWVSLQGIVLFAMHCVGAVFAIPIAWALRRYAFPGQPSTFLMELHSYKWPSIYVLYQRVFERVAAFITRAGSLIFCTSIVVWAAGYFPGDHTKLDDAIREMEKLSQSTDGRNEGNQEVSRESEDLRSSLEAAQKKLNQARSELIDRSFLGMAGRWIEPVVKPLGWDWKIGVATIASFPAREVIIATLGTIYSLGANENEESEGLKEQMRAETWPDGRPVYSLATALSVMVFFALCAQCSATLMTIQRETNSWKWPIFSFVYMTMLAYAGALVTFQIASGLGLAAR